MNESNSAYVCYTQHALERVWTHIHIYNKHMDWRILFCLRFFPMSIFFTTTLVNEANALNLCSCLRLSTRNWGRLIPNSRVIRANHLSTKCRQRLSKPVIVFEVLKRIRWTVPIIHYDCTAHLAYVAHIISSVLLCLLKEKEILILSVLVGFVFMHWLRTGPVSRSWHL